MKYFENMEIAMGKFLDAAKTTLERVGQPLTSKEITDYAIANGILVSEGETPWQTMKSKLSTNILDFDHESEFMRTEKATFALRKWKPEIHEYVSERFRKSPLEEEILVFDAERLKKFVAGNGISTEGFEIASLFDSCFTMQRLAAEDDTSVIQLVSFYIVRFEGRCLTFKRSKRLPESRLHNFYSVAFGGHLNKEDIPSLFMGSFDHDDALTYIYRELQEELILDYEPLVTFVGLLFDDSRPVSRQHLALVYDVELSSDLFEIGERGFLTDPKFESPRELFNRIGDFENWSQLVIKDYIQSDVQPAG